MTKAFKIASYAVFSLSALLITSCGGGDKKKGENTEAIQEDTAKAVSAGVINIGGEMFSIPSPLQTAMLIQGAGAGYDKSILNSKENLGQYATDYSKALNLGIYGADLGYVSMYSKTQDALAYLTSIKKLSDELGLSSAFGAQTMKRFQENMSNKDSMMVLVGLAYREGDAFLKENKRHDISGLILVGGWIESLNFAISVNKTKSNEDIKRRIADQKRALGSIIKLLSQYETKGDYGGLIEELKDLSKVYDTIEYKFVSEKSETDIANKTTTINSHTEVKITKEQLDLITSKVESIRKKIVNPVKA
ncbi:MAG TPA: hypothetical protein VK835_05895 [Bacteroidia bacterium]|jgi:hypothetical protein|nr:hypothetical protein [Bacteroidia bacterium]